MYQTCLVYRFGNISVNVQKTLFLNNRYQHAKSGPMPMREEVLPKHLLVFSHMPPVLCGKACRHSWRRPVQLGANRSQALKARYAPCYNSLQTVHFAFALAGNFLFQQGTISSTCKLAEKTSLSIVKPQNTWKIIEILEGTFLFRSRVEYRVICSDTRKLRVFAHPW